MLFLSSKPLYTFHLLIICLLITVQSFIVHTQTHKTDTNSTRQTKSTTLQSAQTQLAKKCGKITKNSHFWVLKWSKLSGEKKSSPVSNILNNFYFMTQVIIATQSALNRYTNPILKKICFCQLPNLLLNLCKKIIKQ